MNKPLLTHEVGSLAKPVWRIKALKDQLLTEDDIKYAEKWCDKLELKTEKEELLALLSKKSGFNKEEKDRIVYFSSVLATRLIEHAGVDLVCDGEQYRVEMYEYAIRRMKGFDFYGHVRSFDNKYYRKAACKCCPNIKEFYHVDEYKTIASFAKKPLKVPITGAYTLMDWSFDEHYLKGIEIGSENFLEKRKEARKNFLTDLAKKIIYPNMKALADAGFLYVQIDEPAATTKQDEIVPFIQSIIDSVDNELAKKLFLSIHICFSDYSLLFPQIEKLSGIIKEIHLEYANQDTRELGRTAKQRTSYGILKDLAKNNFIVGLGVNDVHTNFIESPELIRDRILYAVEQVGSPEKIFVSPDCGLRTRTWEIAFQKLANMVEGRNLAAKELGI